MTRTQGNRPAGIACPECDTFITMDIELIIAAAAFSCPNPDCSVELRLDAARSARSIDSLRRYAEEMAKLGQPL